jgi:O-phosphoseryl-tRNA(Cys) synthetase
VKNTYKRAINCGKTHMKQSAWFETISGLRQGSVLSLILFNIIIKNVCNKIRQKMNVSDLKAFISANDIIWGHDVKESETRLTRWEGESKNYGLQKKF